jgi:hypothetical protein
LQLLNVTDHVAQVKIAGAFGTWMISTFHPDHLPLLLRHSAKQNTDFPPSTPLDPAQVMDGNTSQVNMSLTTDHPPQQLKSPLQPPLSSAKQNQPRTSALRSHHHPLPCSILTAW